MVFKQSFKYLKNKKINLSKVILKLECLFYQNIYYFILFYIRRAILTQTNPKKGLIEKKNLPNTLPNILILPNYITNWIKRLKTQLLTNYQLRYQLLKAKTTKTCQIKCRQENNRSQCSVVNLLMLLISFLNVYSHLYYGSATNGFPYILHKLI